MDLSETTLTEATSKLDNKTIARRGALVLAGRSCQRERSSRCLAREVPDNVEFVDTAFGYEVSISTRRAPSIYGDLVGKERESCDMPRDPKIKGWRRVQYTCVDAARGVHVRGHMAGMGVAEASEGE